MHYVFPSELSVFEFCKTPTDEINTFVLCIYDLNDFLTRNWVVKVESQH